MSFYAPCAMQIQPENHADDARIDHTEANKHGGDGGGVGLQFSPSSDTQRAYSPDATCIALSETYVPVFGVVSVENAVYGLIRELTDAWLKPRGPGIVRTTVEELAPLLERLKQIAQEPTNAAIKQTWIDVVAKLDEGMRRGFLVKNTYLKLKASMIRVRDAVARHLPKDAP